MTDHLFDAYNYTINLRDEALRRALDEIKLPAYDSLQAFESAEAFEQRKAALRKQNIIIEDIDFEDVTPSHQKQLTNEPLRLSAPGSH